MPANSSPKPAKRPKPSGPKLSRVRLDPRYNYVVLVGGIGALVTVILALFAVRPLAVNLLHASQDLNNKRVQSSQLREKIKDMEALQKSYRDLGSTNRQKILVALPADSDAAHMLAVIETVGARSGVQVRTVTPVESQPGSEVANTPEGSAAPGGASSLPVSIGVRGGYAQILGFLRNLETGPRLMDITGVTFTGTGNPLEAQVTARAYYKGGGSS